MIFESIIHCTPIDKGWSGDRKFCAVTADGSKFLLRISPMERYEQRSREFAKMQEAAALGISMPLPLEFGACEEGIYVIFSWIDGRDARDCVPGMPCQVQYGLGLEAGRILARLHTLPAPEGQPDWADYFWTKTEQKISRYLTCGAQYENGEAMVRYLMENRYLLSNRPVTCQHGDFHIGNMMVERSGKLVVIDFDREDYGDPWEEFNRIVWCAQEAPEFARGRVDGYFEGNVPEEFWRLMAYYVCSNSIGSLPWALSYGQREVDTITRQASDVLMWYDNMNKVVPSWYRKE